MFVVWFWYHRIQISLNWSNDYIMKCVYAFAANQQLVHMWHFFVRVHETGFYFTLFLDSLEINAALHFHFLHIINERNFFLSSWFDWREEEKTPAQTWKHWFVASRNTCMNRCSVFTQKIVLHKNYIFRILMFCNHIINSIQHLHTMALFHVCFEGHTCVTHVQFDCIEIQMNKQIEEYIKWEFQWLNRREKITNLLWKTHGIFGVSALCLFRGVYDIRSYDEY